MELQPGPVPDDLLARPALTHTVGLIHDDQIALSELPRANFDQYFDIQFTAVTDVQFQEREWLLFDQKMFVLDTDSFFKI